MNFKALLVAQDEDAASTVAAVLADFGMSVHSCGYIEAAERLASEPFHIVIVDFDHPQAAFFCLQNTAETTVTAALLSDKTKVRNVFGAGASFVLYKPISPSQAGATLRAAIALLKRERRRAIRIPIQVPVWLRVQNSPEMEGVLLDLSENGMEVLSPQPLWPSGSVDFRFELDETLNVQARGEVAWAKPNGQSGIRFSDLPDALKSRLVTWVADNVKPEQHEVFEPNCKLTDLSVGGCYVETESPFPERSGVALRLRADGMEAATRGTVRVMHPATGMGIEFACITSEQREEVRHFVEFLVGRPGVTPELTVAPIVAPSQENHSLPTLADQHDPLLELLRNHERLNQPEFLQELRDQRSTQVSVD
jgi:CheY-like chemotaxis protein